MSTDSIKWAEASWHCWMVPASGYPVAESGDYTPRAGFRYQGNYRNRDRFSVLDDEGVQTLAVAVKRGEKVMRWRLQHFSDEHATQLESLLANGALTEHDPSSVGLAMVTHRHLIEMGNPRVAKVLVMYMLRLQMTAD